MTKTKQWLDSFFMPIGKGKMINGRIGCFSFSNGILSFSARNKRFFAIDIKVTEEGIILEDIKGKLQYSHDDVKVIAMKVAEIFEDYGKACEI